MAKAKATAGKIAQSGDFFFFFFIFAKKVVPLHSKVKKEAMEIVDLLEYNDRAELRAWLEQHAETCACCWIAMYRGKNKPEGACLPYIDVVEEALCFGWIDSTLKRLPDGRLAQRLSPRRKRSHWTELNRQRCEELEKRGLMTEAGKEALRKSRKNE